MSFLNVKKRVTSSRGYSLVETIAYITLMSLIVGVISYVITMLYNANSIVKATRNVENSAIAATDRIIRETRAATSVDIPNSSFGVDGGILTLNIPSGTGTRTTKFYLSNSRIMVDDNGVLTGPLTLSDTQVSSLRFYYLATTTSKAVKFEMTLVGPASSPGISEKVYGTAVLRGSYVQ